MRLFRENFTSGTKWEPVVGYSRAVRVDNWVLVSGTTATDVDGKIVGVGDMYSQTVQTILNIREILKKSGLRLEHVVRTRIYVTDISRWEEVARAHAEYFGKNRPATCMVQVSALISPEMLVEIEADAAIETV